MFYVINREYYDHSNLENPVCNILLYIKSSIIRFDLDTVEF